MPEEKNVVSTQSKSAYPDWLSTFIVIFLYFWWVMFILVQIKTTEDLFSATKFEVNVFNPDISVLAQVPGIFLGWNTLPNYVIAVGWIIEIVYMAALIKLKPMIEKSKRIHIRHGDILIGFLMACFIVNLGTDYIYGPDWFPTFAFGSHFVGHTLYAVVAEFCIVYFPIMADAFRG